MQNVFCSVVGYIILADVIKPEAKATVRVSISLSLSLSLI